MSDYSNKFKMLTVASGLVLASGSAFAGPSSSAELRGYSKCISAASEQSLGLAANRYYLLNNEGEQNQYFINASRWESGDRVPVRIACETSANGRVLISQAIETGRYATQRGRVSVEVAGR